MSNRIELEKGFEIDSEYERILEKIKEKNFKFVSNIVEEDTYFSDKDLNFINNRTCLRTRKTNEEFLELTYKQKSTEETEKYGKKEVNIALNVKDYDDIKFVIKQLGYIEYVSFKKNRTTYTREFDGLIHNIMIDELEGIGKFIELEILSDSEDKEKMERELQKFVEEFECQDLKPKELPYRDITKKYYDEIK